MALIHLIYVSTAYKKLSTEELDQILESSVRHNSPQAVTGMLLYANGSFMQVLEGEESFVDETYDRIQLDPRHSGIILIDRSPINARDFDRWSMGFRRLGPQDAEANPAYAPLFQDGFDATRIGATKGLALEMLLNFGRRQR